ncbi:MAG: hypothetical protein ACD_28C00294G0001 [uncultured bacterium]|nr:MAG: hypothetical protein ACD_28C00294G0001 [uncultured bacterium]
MILGGNGIQNSGPIHKTHQAEFFSNEFFFNHHPPIFRQTFSRIGQPFRDIRQMIAHHFHPFSALESIRFDHKLTPQGVSQVHVQPFITIEHFKKGIARNMILFKQFPGEPFGGFQSCHGEARRHTVKSFFRQNIHHPRGNGRFGARKNKVWAKAFCKESNSFEVCDTSHLITRRQVKESGIFGGAVGEQLHRVLGTFEGFGNAMFAGTGAQDENFSHG